MCMILTMVNFVLTWSVDFSETAKVALSKVFYRAVALKISKDILKKHLRWSLQDCSLTIKMLRSKYFSFLKMFRASMFLRHLWTAVSDFDIQNWKFRA